jgi:flagellar hook-associated protein 1 FlgK
MPDFVSLNTALSALHAARVRIDTAANNVANASTTGYTRQRVELAPLPPFNSIVGQIGTGVEVVDIIRVRDQFLDNRVRTGQASLSEASVRSDLLGRAELTLSEPDDGITAGLNELWAAFEELALTPTSSAARVATLSTLDQLADRVRSIADGWAQLGQDATLGLTQRVDETNDLLQAVADVNQAIIDSGSAYSPNQLLDRRDALLDSLARTAGASSTVNADGTVVVSLGGVTLVDRVDVSPLTLRPDLQVEVGGTPVAAGGEIVGYQRFLTQDLPALQADLDGFAEDLAGALNAQHQAGWVDGTTQGGDLLTYTSGDAARTLTSAITDPSDLAVSSEQGPPFPSFNGVNAQALANLRTSVVASGGTDTIDGSARQLAVDLGAQVAAAERSVDTQTALASAAEVARQSQHGVSLDEELVQLTEAQHAYDAAARLMSAIDEALDTLINHTGIIGR